jgi:hypothetical protein
VNAADKLWYFDNFSDELRAFAEAEGASYADSQSICALIRNSIYLHSKSTTSIDLQEECQHLARRQVAINTTFIAMFLQKQKLVKSYVRRAVGKTDQDVDLDSLTADVFAAALRKLTAGGYVYQSQGQENALVKIDRTRRRRESPRQALPALETDPRGRHQRPDGSVTSYVCHYS